MRSLFVSVITVLIGLAPGCYNPDLGRNPFLCATSGQECPSGYTCEKNTQVCIKKDLTDGGSKVEQRILTDAELMPSKEGPVYLDGAPVQSSKGCPDEQSEPNNTAAKATLIPNPGHSVNWSICYPGDVDQYKIPVTIGDHLVIEVEFTASKGDLDIALVDPGGNVVDASRGLTNNKETVSAPLVDKDGNYILGVYGFGPATNTYDITINRTK